MSRRRTFHLLSAEPSKADRLITERLKQALAIYRQHPQSRLFRFCTGKYRLIKGSIPEGTY